MSSALHPPSCPWGGAHTRFQAPIRPPPEGCRRVTGHGTLTSLTPRPQVRERDLPFVTHTLSSEFTILRVVNGETVAAENLGITNGFVKPKMGELGRGGALQRRPLEVTRSHPRAAPERSMH